MKTAQFSVLTLSAMITFSCNSLREKEGMRNVKQDSPAIVSSVREQATIKPDESVHFFSYCDRLTQQMGEGNLQEVEGNPRRDSTGPFVSAACYDCKDTFEVYFNRNGSFADRRIAMDTLFYHFSDSCAQRFLGFDCFAFVLPMQNPDSIGPEAIGIKFPVFVKVYKRLEGDEWELMKNVKITSFPKYTRLIFNTLYGY